MQYLVKLHKEGANFIKINRKYMRQWLGLLFALLLFSETDAQYYDSVSFVSANWKAQRLDRKVRLYQNHFSSKNVFKANENISYVLIKKGKRSSFRVAAEPSRLRTVSDMAAENNALVAVNGNFFDMKNGGAVDFTRVSGQVINVNRKGKDEKLDFHQKAAIVIDKGRLAIKKWDGLTNWEEWLKEPDIMLNGPLLLFNKQNERLDSVAFNVARHPRTCVGITRRGHLILLVVDGRQANSAGMSLFELTKIMRWLGCVSAINFDGGGSSTLWVRDKGVINYPTDNKQWDHEGARKVANILYLKPRK